jgi:6,7-dimethyl-8-ribityllumazine synthase
MLTSIANKTVRATGTRFAIVAARYNARYVDAMLRVARAELKRAGAGKIDIIRVPGAFEIPVVAARLASSAFDAPMGNTSLNTRLSAIICLGVILRGETTHAAHIGEAVTQALMNIQVRYQLPIVHTVLLLENEAQARVRCLGRKHNRGAEAAHTALAMAEVMTRLPSLPILQRPHLRQG